MQDVALGTKVFKRYGDLRRLLESIPETKIQHVYIADDGDDSPAERALSEVDLGLDVTIFDLEYDVGNGHARREIVEQSDEDFLLMVDPDHTIPKNVDTLYNQVTQQDRVGGVAGSIIEPDENRMWQSGKKFFEENGGLVSDATGDHAITTVAGEPFVRFDFVPQAILFKRECLEAYAWDRNYITRREHADFFVGHWKETKWQFGVAPGVLFGHYPGGNADYESHRRSPDKHAKDDQYFLEKWDYEFFEMRDPYWFNTDTSNIGIAQRIHDVYSSEGLLGLTQRGIGLARTLYNNKR